MEMLLTQTQIAQKTYKIAYEITQDHKKSGNELPPVFICILNGGFMFITDLVKQVDLDMEIDFIRAKSYNGKDNSGGVKITKGIETDLKGKRVYLVDDLIDTGETVKELLFYLEDYRPQEIKVVTAFHRRDNPHPVDFYACEVGDEWLVGYGLDDNRLKRNLTNLYAL